MTTEGHKQKTPHTNVESHREKEIHLAQMQKIRSNTHIQDAYCGPNLFAPELNNVKGSAYGSHVLIYLKMHF